MQFFDKMQMSPEKRAAAVLQYNKFDREKAISHLLSDRDHTASYAKPGAYGFGPDRELAYKLHAQELDQAAEMLRQGKPVGPRTYEVDIHANPERLLNWDKQLADQSPDVRRALSNFEMVRGNNKAHSNYNEALERALTTDAGTYLPPLPSMPRDYTGKQIHNELRDQLHLTRQPPAPFRQSSADLAAQMNQSGIQGIKYFDGRSRAGEGTPTHNYVIFDDKLIDINRRYAEGGEVSEGRDMNSHIARALHLARGGYATPGFVDDQPEEEYPDGARPLTIYRNPSRTAPAGAMDVSGDQGPSYDQMGNVTSPGRNADPIVDAAMRVIPPRSYAKDPELLAQEIQDYKRKVAEREATPEYYRQMTHYNINPPLAPVEIEGGFIGKRAIGEAPYDNAEARSKFFQTLYDMKTLPLYAAGSVFPPAAGLGMALDTAEGVAAGSPTQVAMGAFGAPGKVMK
jgi:hypothetical protein